MAKPASIQCLPEWLSAQQSQLRTRLSSSREKDLEKYSEQLSLTKKLFDSLPGRSALFEVYSDSLIVRKTACPTSIFGFVLGYDLRRFFVCG
jgi:hypothetical protein